MKTLRRDSSTSTPSLIRRSGSRKAAMLPAPAQNMATRSSAASWSIVATTSSGPAAAAFRNDEATPTSVRAERERLRGLDARPHPAAGDQRQPRRAAPRHQQRLGGRDAPVGERARQLAEAHRRWPGDTRPRSMRCRRSRPRRSPRPRLVQPPGGGLADAPADLLGDHRARPTSLHDLLDLARAGRASSSRRPPARPPAAG